MGLKHNVATNFKWHYSVHEFKWLYFLVAEFLRGYTFMWQIVYLTPMALNCKKMFFLISGLPQYNSFWKALMGNENKAFFYFNMSVRSRHIMYGQ